MSQTDTLMLNSYSTEAIAASSLSTQIIMLMTFLVTIIHVGTSIRLVHLKEHNDLSISKEIYHNLSLNLVVSLIFTIVIGILFSQILWLFQVPKDIFRLTYQFGLILLSVFTLITCQMFIGTVLRMVNHARSTTRITVISNMTNILLNSIVLFVVPHQIGNPVLAVATAISRLIGCVLATITLLRVYRPQLSDFKLSWYKIHSVLSLGVPSAGEQISYNLAQTFTTAFIAMLGTQVIAAKSVSTVLSSISFSYAMAFSTTSQIYFGKLIAHQRNKVLQQSVNKSILFNIMQSFIIMFCVVIAFIMLGPLITHDTQTYHLIIYYLLILIGLEPLRAINNLIADLLNVAGDIRFPVTVSILTTWILLLPGSYILGIKCGFGYTGIILVNIVDEGLRFILMFKRWRKGRWKALMKQIGV